MLNVGVPPCGNKFVSVVFYLCAFARSAGAIVARKEPDADYDESTLASNISARVLVEVGDKGNLVLGAMDNATIDSNARVARKAPVARTESGAGKPRTTAGIARIVERSDTVPAGIHADVEVAGIPIFNYGWKHPALGSEAAKIVKGQVPAQKAAEALVAPTLWIVALKKGCNRHDLDDICSNLPSNSACIFEGDPDHGGIEDVVINATEAEIEEIIRAHAGAWHGECTMKEVEPDTVFFAIPETKLAGAESLLESDQPSLNMWGLDRIDSRHGLDGVYGGPVDGGEDVHIYILDTGIRVTHVEFNGRAIPTIESLGTGVKECQNGMFGCADDKHGHGTHCAGIVGGRTSGVAKAATIHSVKILDDEGMSSLQQIIQAVNWVMIHGIRPAVASMSIGNPKGQSMTAKSAITAAVESGVVVVTAAGNEYDNACHYTPSWVPAAITVGATNNQDRRPSWSNYGPCVDIFAPGVSIISTSHESDGAIAMLSGSSMACPHVAGAVALLLWSGVEKDEVGRRLLDDASLNIISNVPDSTPNRLLYVDMAKLLSAKLSTTATGTIGVASRSGFSGAARSNQKEGKGRTEPGREGKGRAGGGLESNERSS
jgi:hypothetical protein